MHKSYSLVEALSEKWNNRADCFIEKQKNNPFSDRYGEKLCKLKKLLREIISFLKHDFF